MNGLSQWRLVVYLVAIFAAGSVSGWVVATKMAKQNAFKAPQPKEIATSLRDRLHSKLNLNPEQSQKIDAIIERSSAEMQSIHGENIKRIKQGVSNRNAQIVAVLTPEQQKDFEQMEKERQESWRGRHGGHDGPRGPRDKASTNSVRGGPY
jgi:Spy/CpxP family protein refolding chaperone